MDPASNCLPNIPPHQNVSALKQTLRTFLDISDSSFLRMMARVQLGKVPRPLEQGALSGARILVTGGSSGIGLAAAKQMIDAGAAVVVTARTEEKARNTETTLKTHSADADITILVCDADKIEEIIQLAKNLQCGRLDGAILNWGGTAPAGPWEINDLGWNKVIHTNVLTPALLALKLLPVLRESAIKYGVHAALEGASRIVFVSSDSQALAPLCKEFKSLFHLSPEAYLRSFGTRKFSPQFEAHAKSGIYMDSKLILLAWAQELGFQMRPGSEDEVVITSATPGVCATTMLHESEPKALSRILLKFARSPECGAQMLLNALARVPRHDAQASFVPLGMKSPKPKENPWLSTPEGEDFIRRVWIGMKSVLQKFDKHLYEDAGLVPPM